jgi:hypothetical protein
MQRPHCSREGYTNEEFACARVPSGMSYPYKMQLSHVSIVLWAHNVDPNCVRILMISVNIPTRFRCFRLAIYGMCQFASCGSSFARIHVKIPRALAMIRP